MNRTDFAHGFAAGVVSAIVVALFVHIVTLIEPGKIQQADSEQLQHICAGLWGCGAPPMLGSAISLGLVALMVYAMGAAIGAWTFFGIPASIRR